MRFLTFLTNIFLPGLSIISLLFSIGDACQDLGWFIGFCVLAILLIIGGIVMLCKKLTKISVSVIVISSGLLIAGVLAYNYRDQVQNSKRNELWRDTVIRNIDESAAMTDLEKSALLEKDARAQYNLAHHYLFAEDGYGLDFEMAQDLAQKAADQGNSKAHALLALIYTKGYGCKPDSQQAFSNIMLSIKGGYEQGLSQLSLLDSASFRISSKDSLDIEECVKNSAYLDSLYYEVREAFPNNQRVVSIIRANKERCLRLSDDDYFRATELLYYEALGDSLQKQQLHHYASKLMDYDRIPDYPTMRTFYFDAVKGQMQPTSLPDDDKDIVERFVTDQDFWLSIILDNFDRRFIQDLFYRYEYDTAFYKRSQYLLANHGNLNSFFFESQDNLDQMHAIAKSHLMDCTAELRTVMMNRPLVFSTTQPK